MAERDERGEQQAKHAVKGFVAGPEGREPSEAEARAMAEALWEAIARPEDLDAEDRLD